MFDHVLELAARLGHWTYALVFIVATLESAAFLGIFVPGETLTVSAGFLVSAGVLELVPTVVAAALGATLGDSIGYEMGRRLGRPWLERHGARFGFHSSRLAQVDALFARFGGVAVVVARFIGFLRAMAPFIAGASHMRYPRFLLFNAIGAWLWATTFVLLGYFLGESWWMVERWIGRAGLIVAAVVIVGVALVLHRLRRVAT